MNKLLKHIKVGKCLLLFLSESSVLLAAV